MQFFYPMIAVLPGVLTGALSVVAAIVVSFVVITLIASYFRFQRIVQVAEDTHPEDMDVSTSDLLRVQLARYLTDCARRGSSFSLALIQANDASLAVGMGDPFVKSIKQAVRHNDIVCVYDEKTAALIAESEPDDAESILERVVEKVKAGCSEVLENSLRMGVSSYPGHGLSGKDLLNVAKEALAQAHAEQPIFVPEIVEVEEEGEEGEEGEKAIPEQEEAALAEEAVETVPDEQADLDAGDDAGEAGRQPKGKGWMASRKSGILDDLTGVLKPSAVSAYMQRMMNDVRHKRKQAALFCVGVNNIEHIVRFHGEEAGDDILVGVSRILQDSVRATDLIGRHEKHAFLVLAQVSLENAEIIGKRISTLVQQSEISSGAKKLKTTVTIGIAAYPEHGRNLHLLYKAGQKVLDHNRANDIRAYAVYDPKIHDSMPSKPMSSIKSRR